MSIDNSGKTFDNPKATLGVNSVQQDHKFNPKIRGNDFPVNQTDVKTYVCEVKNPDKCALIARDGFTDSDGAFSEDVDVTMQNPGEYFLKFEDDAGLPMTFHIKT